jgi:hypothetical protein
MQPLQMALLQKVMGHLLCMGTILDSEAKLGLQLPFTNLTRCLHTQAVQPFHCSLGVKKRANDILRINYIVES